MVPEPLLLRPFQKEALERLRHRVHLICQAPTGSGKSLIFERWMQMSGFRTVLITPLVALARQQAEQLRRAQIKVSLGCGSSETLDFTAQTWILSPESLHKDRKKETILKWKPQALVVDECHCLWEWGESFRPSFYEIPKLLQAAEIQSSLWLSATLPTPALQELTSLLPGYVEIMGEFELPERLTLYIEKVPWSRRLDALLRIARTQGNKAPGLVFVSTRAWAERLARLLEAAGLATAFYHAGMAREERLAIEKRLREDKLQAVVSTSAFGMGIDFPLLRWTVLWQPTLSLLALAQSIGRVGRQGREGTAWVFWDQEDFHILERLASTSPRQWNEWLMMKRFLEATSRSDPKQALKRYFSII